MKKFLSFGLFFLFYMTRVFSQDASMLVIYTTKILQPDNDFSYIYMYTSMRDEQLLEIPSILKKMCSSSLRLDHKTQILIYASEEDVKHSLKKFSFFEQLRGEEYKNQLIFISPAENFLKKTIPPIMKLYDLNDHLKPRYIYELPLNWCNSSVNIVLKKLEVENK